MVSNTYLVDLASSTAYGPLTVTVVKPNNKILNHFLREINNDVTLDISIVALNPNFSLVFFTKKVIFFLEFRILFFVSDVD